MIERLMELAANPFVWVAAILGLAAVSMATRRPELFVYLLAGFAVLVSITPPTLRDPSGYIPLWGPLETLRNNNRYFAVVAGVVLVLTMKNVGLGNSRQLPLTAILLLITHGLIFLKNLSEVSDVVYVALLYLGFVVVVIAYWTFISAHSSRRQLIHTYMTLMIAIGATFFALNFFQFLVNRAATSIVGGRFHGITNNPQMFVISIAPFFPVAFYTSSWGRNYIFRVASIVILLISLYWCYLTGSRLALLSIVIGFGVYYQMRGGELIGVILVALIVLLGLQALDIRPEISEDSRIFSTSDTRSSVWLSQWQIFLENPLLGQRFTGERVTFGESTWLGAAAGLGIAGLLPMLILGLKTLNLFQAILNDSDLFSSASEQSVVLSILAVSFAGTFFEAFLFGILTLPMIVFLVSVMTIEQILMLPFDSEPIADTELIAA